MEHLDGEILVVAIISAGSSRLPVDQVGGVGGGWGGPTESRQGGVSAAVCCVLAMLSTHMYRERGLVKKTNTQQSAKPQAHGLRSVGSWPGR